MRTDAELLAAVAEGDPAALRQLFDAHAGWLVLRLSQRCGDRGLVDETVQDTFVRAWRHAGSYRGDGDVGAWLWGIAVRRLIDRLRQRRPVPVEVAERDLDEVVEAAEDQLLRGIEHGDLGTALGRLAPELRAVMQACVLDGLTHREAGDLLGIPAGTVKSRMHRARKQLREAIT